MIFGKIEMKERNMDWQSIKKGAQIQNTAFIKTHISIPQKTFNEREYTNYKTLET